MARKRKNKTPKKRSFAVRAALWTVPIAAGAVVGAYAVRWIDGLRSPAKADGPQPLAGPVIDADFEELGGPRPNPLAMAAITPVIAAPVAVPYLTTAIPPTASYPTPYTAPHVEPVENPSPVPKRRSSAEVRAEREANFDELVRKFESGDVDFE